MQILALFSILATAAYGLDIFHQGKEYEYDIQTSTYVGPDEEHLHDESGFSYGGKLIVQREANEMLKLKLKIEDVYVANGESTSFSHNYYHQAHHLEIDYHDHHHGDDDKHHQEHPRFQYKHHKDHNEEVHHSAAVKIDLSHPGVSEHIQEIERPFGAEVDEHGKVTRVKVSFSEHLWSVNMKKAIASFLQVPIEDKHDYVLEDEDGFHSRISSSYQLVERGSKTYVYVSKSPVDFKNESHIFSYSSHKYDPVSCKTEDCKAILYDNPVKGKIILRQKDHVLEEAEFHQIITTHPFDHAGHSFNSDASFYLQLQKESDISSNFEFPNDLEEQSLTFHMTEHFRRPYNPEEPIKTTLYMETEFDQEKTYQKVLEKIDFIATHLETSKDEDKIREMSLLITPYLEALDFTHLEKAYEHFGSLKKDSEIEKSVFIKMLSLTRTGHATLLLYKLATEGKISGFLGHESDISTQVLNLMYPHHRLVDKIWGYLKDYEYTPEHVKVYEDMYLSLGILASKICERGCTRESMLKNKIVRDIIEKLKEHKHDKQGELYAMVLSNVDSEETRRFFKNVVFDFTYDFDIRTTALWAVEEDYREHPEEMRRQFIQYVYNETLPYLFRMEVLEMIMEVDTYETCYGLLTGLKNPDMKHFAHHIIRAQADTPHFSPRHYGIAHKLLQNIHLDEKRYTGSSMEQFNFYDEKHHYGMRVDVITVASPDSVIPQRIDVEVEEIFAGRLMAPYQMHVYLHNVDSMFRSHHKYSSKDKVDYDEREEKFYAEVRFLQDHKYVMWLHFDADTVMEMMKNLHHEGAESFIKKFLGSFNIFQEYQMDFMTFNALGQPVEFRMITPTFMIFKEHLENFPKSFDFHYKTVYTNMMSVHALNPISHLLHGTTYINKVTFDMPISGHFEDGKHPSLKLKFDEEFTHFFDVNSHGYTYIKGAGEDTPHDSKALPYLKEHGIEMYHEVNHTKFEDICEYHDKHHLYGVNVISHCEYGNTFGGLMKHFFEEYFEEHTDHNRGMGMVLSGISKIYQYLHLQPDSIPFNMEISHIPDVTEIELKDFTYNHNDDHDKMSLSAGIDVDVKLLDNKHLKTHLVFEYSHKESELKDNFQIKAINDFSGTHNEVCFTATSHFHSPHNKFDVSSEDSSKITAKLNFGDKCDSDKSSFITADVTTKMSKKHLDAYLFPVSEVADSEEMTIFEMQERDEMPHEFENIRKLCRNDIAEMHIKSHIPLTKHCFEYMYDASILNKRHASFHWGNLPAFMQEYLDKFISFGKVYMMPYWHFDTDTHEKLSEGDGHIAELNGEACMHTHKASMKFSTEHGNYQFTDVPFSAFPFVPLFSSRIHTYFKYAYDHHLIGYCDVNTRRVNIMEDYIIPYNLTECPTVISKDCSGRNLYSIKAHKINHPTYQLAMSIELGFDHHYFDLAPESDAPNCPLRVKFIDTKTGSEKELSHDEYAKYNLHHYDNSVIFDEFFRSGLKVGYDGHYASVIVTPRHKGRQCGLCGEFRGQMGPIVAPPKGHWTHEHGSFHEQIEYSPNVSEMWEEKCH